MKRPLLFTLPLLLLAGCGGRSVTFEGARTFGYDDFPVVRTLDAGQAETVLDGHALLNPGMFCLLDSLVLTADRHAPSVLNLYSLATGTLKASFLREGHGPGEVVSLSEMRDLPHLRAVAVREAGNGKVLLYGYDDLAAATGEIRPRAVYRELPSSALLSEQRVLSKEPDTLAGPGRLKTTDGEGRTLERFGDYPRFPNELPPDRCRELLSTGLSVVLSPDAGKALLADGGSDFFELWDLSTRTRTALLHGPDRILPELVVRQYDNLTVTSFGRYTAYTDAAAGERCVWLLYDGTPFDLSFDSEEEALEQEEPNNRLLCFDWQGNPLACWQLPYSVSAMAIDRGGRRVYCLTSDEGQAVLVRFPLGDY
ncbi:MAG: hypothetical protein J6K95_06065 [Rikenellaceae bacterium]|nr:hypothetical protein [Rikenellaceae bacterium]